MKVFARPFLTINNKGQLVQEKNWQKPGYIRRGRRIGLQPG
jgi:hypothetical protein